MRQFISTAASLLFATSAYAALEERDLCASGSVNDGGNWYCQEVDAITYTGVGGAGSYNKVTNMDGTTGACSSTPFGYSGTMSPLDEEVSLHFRGPLTLKQFAVYTPGSSSSKKTRRSHIARHAHAHGNAHAHAHEERALGDIVTATIDGQVVTWANDYSGAAATSPAEAAPVAAAVSTAAAVVNNVVAAASSAVSSAAAPASSSETSSGSAGSWSRQAYYSASSGQADGLVFLSHNGGSGSGVFDYSFGNSLSYSSTNGQQGAASPQVLEDCTLPSDAEVVIMSDQECSGDSCGYYRPGTVAHHGFGGAQKAFFFEFGMPDDGKTSSSIYDPVNMPAIWMLNAQIPRTLQYGNADCSCWTSGCAEFDIFEVLAPGDKRCKSTLHGNVNGGSSDYFARPVSGTIKAVLLMTEDNIHIKLLDSSYEFGSSLDSATVSDICASTDTQTNDVSLFALAQ